MMILVSVYVNEFEMIENDFLLTVLFFLTVKAAILQFNASTKA